MGADDPVPIPPIAVEGCNEYAKDVFTLNGLGSVSVDVPWVPGTNIDGELAAARGQILAAFFNLCVRAAALAGVAPPDCPRETCEPEGGMGCVPSFHITEHEDYTETGAIIWKLTPSLIPVRYYRLTFHFAVDVSVDAGCTPCLADPANIG